MEPCRVRNVSDTRVGHVSCIFLKICHMFACRIHFNVAVSVQHRHGIGLDCITDPMDLFDQY